MGFVKATSQAQKGSSAGILLPPQRLSAPSITTRYSRSAHWGPARGAPGNSGPGAAVPARARAAQASRGASPRLLGLRTDKDRAPRPRAG